MFVRQTLYEFCTRKCKAPDVELNIYRLPFGLVLKVGNTPEVNNEACALKALKDLGAIISHPSLFDCVPCQNSKKSYMVSTWILGDCVSDVWDSLTATDKIRFEQDLREQCDALRSQTQTLEHAIFSAAGGPVVDYRVPWLLDNPREFRTCQEFASQVWLGMDHNTPARMALRPVMLPIMQRTDVYISLCHGDLFAKNMIFPGGLDNWRAGRSRLCLIDWEQAGWMPVYWDALKATWMEMDKDTEWFNMARRIFPDFTDVLDADWEWRSRSKFQIL